MEEESIMKTLDLSEFKKLGLKGWRHVYNSGKSYFEEVDLGKEIEENYSNCKTVVIAIHVEPKRETVEYLAGELKWRDGSNFSYEEAFEFALYNECYPIANDGFKTYWIIGDPEHIYSTRDYWTDNKRYKVSKRKTKDIYTIHIK